jgi:ABC-type spermidine/putrescine transport system permease subunit II
MKIAAIAAAVLVAIGLVAYLALWVFERFNGEKKS